MYQKSLPSLKLCDEFSFKDTVNFNNVIRLVRGLKKWKVRAIMLAGGGEPLVHPQIKEIIQFILENDIELGLITNGAKLDNSWIPFLKNKNFKWIRISLDAGNAKTWKKVHQPLSFNDFDKILSFVKTVKKEEGIKTDVGASFIINDINYEEIISFTEKCKKNGFDNVRISFTYQAKREKLYLYKKEIILRDLNKAKKLENERFRVNILDSRLESIEKRKKNYPKCYFPFFSISVGANLIGYPCCMTKYAKRFRVIDFNKKIDLALLKELNENLHQIEVSKCPTCWYDSFNEQCNYCLEDGGCDNFIN